MCLGVPGRLLDAPDPETGSAPVDVGGQTRQVSCVMLEDAPTAGQWVIIHLGLALEVLEEDEAQELLGYLRELEAPTAANGERETS